MLLLFFSLPPKISHKKCGEIFQKFSNFSQFYTRKRKKIPIFLFFGGKIYKFFLERKTLVSTKIETIPFVKINTPLHYTSLEQQEFGVSQLKEIGFLVLSNQGKHYYKQNYLFIYLCIDKLLGSIYTPRMPLN
jgi:hypothetical protein